MARYGRNNGGGTLFLVAIGFAVFIFSMAAPFLNEHVDTYSVSKITEVQDTHGDENGFSTDVYYMVYTDKGAYSIQMTGFNAHPECAGQIYATDTCRFAMRTRGIRIPFLGIYPNIIEIVERHE